MHPDFPVITGQQQISDEWELTLASDFNRRVEDDSLVLWKPGFTVWISLWGNDQAQSIEERLTEWKADVSDDATDLRTEADRFSYRVKDEESDAEVAALVGFVFGRNGQVQTTIYFDDEAAAEEAHAIFASFKEI